ncbi:OmpH family outer membrane protein [uncultured Sphingomonas sp.]|uniref:OmpH family outer membrane protein n=1 Tax=uncultured Sphingomonas sp. TaxID=158754 RepID=UPI0035C9B39D
MTSKIKLLSAGAVAAIAAVAVTPAAHAQTVAIADPEQAVVKTAAFTSATATIQATYKTQLATADSARKEVEPLLAALDTNKDGQLSQPELAAAQAANNPSLATIQAKQTQIQTAEAPAARAQQYVLEQISAKLPQAVQSVIAARKISMILRPQAAIFADQTADITGAITTELNKLVPTVSATPPAGWQPGQAGAAGAAAGTPAPAAGGKKPSGR